MVINDKLKGEFYRAPMTKLASRKNVWNTINDLIEYYNKLVTNLNECFDTITDEREVMINSLVKIYEKTIHFQYVLEHFELEVDQHITEKLNSAINSFQSTVSTLVQKYDANVFNHNSANDGKILSMRLGFQDLEEWQRSVDSLSTDLGIRWFGGKIQNTKLISELNSIIRLTKVNNYDGKKNEDFINSNLILEIFLYTVKGIVWLELGQNATFGYNLITKYISEGIELNMDIVSETYNTSKEFDLNVFDFDMILNTFLTQEDRTNGNVYIKVKTNIPSNAESGKEGYYLSSSNKFDDYEYKKALKNFAIGNIYHDNKDVAIVSKDIDEGSNKLDTIINAFEHLTDQIIETPLLVNPKSKKFLDMQYNTDEKEFHTNIHVSDKNISQQVFNPNGDKMENLSDNISGYTLKDSDFVKNTKYFENEYKFNKEFNVASSNPLYEKGESLVNPRDDRSLNIVSALTKNETMFEIDSLESHKSVIPSDYKYSSETNEKTIYNKNFNNDKFTYIDSETYKEEVKNIICPLSPHGPDIHGESLYATCQIDDNNILISKPDGLYRLQLDSNLGGDYPAIKVSFSNGNVTTIYDIILNRNGNPILATNAGIYIMKMDGSYSTELYGTVGTGVPSHAWVKLFLIGSKGNEQVVAIRRDFTTTTLNGQISYGDSMAIENVSDGYMTLFSLYYSDSSCYTTSAAVSNELANGSTLNPNNEQYFTKPFTILKDETNDQIFLFKFGRKMLCSNNNGITINSNNYNTVKNLHVVDAMASFDITYAVLKDNKIYFTTALLGFYIYDIATNTVKRLENNSDFNITKVINGRTTRERIYYLDGIERMFDSNADLTNTEIVDLGNTYVKICNNNIFFIPDYTQFDQQNHPFNLVRDIIYVNGYYYVLDKDDYIWKLDENLNIKGVIECHEGIIKDITSVGNMLLIVSPVKGIATDDESKLHYSAFDINQVQTLTPIITYENK